MSIIRKIFYFINSILVNISKKNVRVSLSSKIRPGTFIGKYIRISKGTYIKGEIGDYTYIGENCILNAQIGKFCSISSNVKVVNATHPIHMVSTSPVFYSSKKQCGYTLVLKNKFDEILYADTEKKFGCIIGNDVWIGENVIIKGGITIGNGAIIAMGAIVTKDVPPYSIFGGVPAKEISKRFDDKKINYLLNLEWWNKSEEWLKKYKQEFLDINKFIKKIN